MPGILLATLVGCGSSPPRTKQKYGAVRRGRPQTRIISGSPDRDAKAFNQSQQQLSKAKWDVIDKSGPQPVWKKWNTPRNKRFKKAQEDDHSRLQAHGSGRSPTGRDPAGRGPTPTASKNEGSTRKNKPESALSDEYTNPPAKVEDPPTVAGIPLDPSAQILQNPSHQDKDPGDHANDKYQANPAAGDKVQSNKSAGKSVSQLEATDTRTAKMPPREKPYPLTVLRLSAKRVQLIWKLRNYGGPSVQARADGTNFRQRKVKLKPPDLSPLVDVLKTRLGKKASVQALPRQNTLVLTCNKDQRQPIVDLLSKLDVPQAQVEITAEIFEVSNDFDYQQGARVLIKHLSGGNTQSAQSTFDTNRLLKSIGKNAPFQGSVIGLMQEFQAAGISLNVSLQLLAETGLIKVIASPRLMVASGQSGYMLAGKELPIQSSKVSGDKIIISTDYKPVGVQLYITPQSVSAQRVKLHMVSQVSSVAGFSPLPSMSTNNPVTRLVNPIIKSREAQTEVNMEQGSTLVISGLRRVRTLTRTNQIPLLGDIPLIGNFFKNQRSQQQITDLYFFITPTLIRP